MNDDTTKSNTSIRGFRLTADCEQNDSGATPSAFRSPVVGVFEEGATPAKSEVLGEEKAVAASIKPSLAIEEDRGTVCFPSPTGTAETVWRKSGSGDIGDCDVGVPRVDEQVCRDAEFKRLAQSLSLNARGGKECGVAGKDGKTSHAVGFKKFLLAAVFHTTRWGCRCISNIGSRYRTVMKRLKA